MVQIPPPKVGCGVVSTAHEMLPVSVNGPYIDEGLAVALILPLPPDELPETDRGCQKTTGIDKTLSYKIRRRSGATNRSPVG